MAEGHVREVRENVQEFDLGGKRLNLIAEGRLVNLGAAEGHPAAVMDMSFANQALSAEYVATHHAELEPRVYVVPEAIDAEVARLKLAALGINSRRHDPRTGRIRRVLAARDLTMADPVIAPYGAWSSSIRVDDVVGDVIDLAEPWLDGDDTYWLEERPVEDGRRVLVRAAADGSKSDLTPPPFNVRTRVHEYGGGSYTVGGGIVVFSNFSDGRLYRLDPDTQAPVAITAESAMHYADLRIDLGRGRVLAVARTTRVKGSPPPLSWPCR